MAQVNLEIVLVRILPNLALGFDDAGLLFARDLLDFHHANREHPVVAKIVMQGKLLPFLQADFVQCNVCRRAFHAQFFRQRIILIAVFAEHFIVHAELIQMLMEKVKRLHNRIAQLVKRAVPADFQRSVNLVPQPQRIDLQHQYICKVLS